MGLSGWFLAGFQAFLGPEANFGSFFEFSGRFSSFRVDFHVFFMNFRVFWVKNARNHMGVFSGFLKKGSESSVSSLTGLFFWFFRVFGSIFVFLSLFRLKPGYFRG